MQNVKNKNNKCRFPNLTIAPKRLSLGRLRWVGKIVLFVCWFSLPCGKGWGGFSFSQSIKNNSEKPHSNWEVKNPLYVKYFVENKGQDSAIHSVTDQKVQYGTALVGTNYYFSLKSIVFRYRANELKPGEGKKNKEKEEGELAERTVPVEEQLELEWLGSSSDCKLVSEEKGTCKFRFQQIKGSSEGYKKLIYKNIYPGIDIEVLFQDSVGIKYNILLHPGAELSDVKMKYHGYKTIKTSHGNLLVNGNHLSILDHAPIAFYKDNGEKIPCKFEVNNGIVQFSAGAYDHTKEAVIDPWLVSSPTCPSKVYDIQKDAAGNVYINGGAPGAAMVEKYTSAGALLWTYNYSPQYMGDIATDNAGNTVVTWGCCGGERFRLGPSGVLLWNNSGGYEYWRLSYDSSKTILSVGGYFTSGGNNLGRIDPNTGNVTNQINYGLETRSIVTDLNGDIYSLHVTFGQPGSTSSNKLNKTLANFTPSLSILSGYTMDEYGFNYAPGQFIGFNGIAVQRCLLYTYDGLTIHAWKKCDLTLFGSVNVPGGVVQNDGGITVDQCYNVYAGSATGIYQYDLFLNPISNVSTPSSVYDIIYAGAGDFLACGEGFIGSYHFGNISCNQNVNPCTNANIIATPPSVCMGDSTSLVLSTIGVGGNTQWYQSSSSNGPWSLISGVAGNTYIFKPTAAGTFYFETKISCGGDTTTTSIAVVHASPAPVVNFIAANSCFGHPSVFTDSSFISLGSISSWHWDFGDSGISTLQNPSHTYATCGTYNVKLIAISNSGCRDSITKAITVHCLPIANFGFADVCLHQPVNFHDSSIVANGTITSWAWNFGDATPVNNTASPIYSYLGAGTYIVSLVVTTDSGCKDTITKSLIVHPLPKAKFTTTNVCDGNIVPFHDLSTIAIPDNIQSWKWNFGDNSPVYNNQDTSHLYNAAGSYNVKLSVVSNFGCSDSITITVTVNPNPVVKFGADKLSGCTPLCVSFNDSSTISSGLISHWAWNAGDGSVAGVSKNFEHCYTNISVFSPALYTVTLTATSDSGCISTASKNNYITVFPNPNASFTVQPQAASIINPVISITDLSTGATAWQWNFGDITTSSFASPLPHTYKDTGTFIIRLITSTSYGCYDTAYQTVIIDPDFEFYIPNAFTPDGDGKNETFSGKGIFIKEYEMMIFDRWGNLIFYTDNLDKPWDGRANHGNDMAQRDVYVYVVKITDFRNKKHSYKGTVTLVR